MGSLCNNYPLHVSEELELDNLAWINSEASNQPKTAFEKFNKKQTKTEDYQD